MVDAKFREEGERGGCHVEGQRDAVGTGERLETPECVEHTGIGRERVSDDRIGGVEQRGVGLHADDELAGCEEHGTGQRREGRAERIEMHEVAADERAHGDCQGGGHGAAVGAGAERVDQDVAGEECDPLIEDEDLG